MYWDAQDQAHKDIEINDLERNPASKIKPISAEFEGFVMNLVAEQRYQIQTIQIRNKWLANRILDLHDRFHEVGVDLEHQVKAPKPIPGKKDILMLLYPNYPLSFDFSLCLSSPLPSCLNKKNYIIFDVYTSPNHISQIDQCSRIPLVTEAYSSHFPPRILSTNNKGTKLLIGTSKCLMKYCAKRKCYCAYFKLKVSEVTSHCMNGWIFIVIRPESLELFPNIKPLILKKVVISSRNYKAIRNE